MHRVLSIQSHVVHGYVGNKCAVFPLQLLGIDVDSINSVHLSNHTGYKHFKGSVLNANELQDLINGLQLNDLDNYSHILTGYVGSTSFLNKVADVVKELKEKNSNRTYVCDPVLGDNGKMYVPKENLQVYKDRLIPLADIMTPNQYEVEWLTGIQIRDIRTAVEALNYFHNKGVKVIVITSTRIPTDTKAELLIGFASQISNQGEKLQLRFNIPVLPGQFTGVGDLFTAVFLAWMAKTNQNLKTSCEKTFSTLQHVMKRTLSEAQHKESDNEVARMELQIVSSKKHIEDPEIIVRGEELTID